MRSSARKAIMLQVISTIGYFNCIHFDNNSQEPDPEDVIKTFAAGYHVKFDMFSKINVNGSNALPLYKYLKSQLKGTLGRYGFTWCVLLKFNCN